MLCLCLLLSAAGKTATGHATKYAQISRFAKHLCKCHRKLSKFCVNIEEKLKTLSKKEDRKKREAEISTHVIHWCSISTLKDCRSFFISILAGCFYLLRGLVRKFHFGYVVLCPSHHIVRKFGGETHNLLISISLSVFCGMLLDVDILCCCCRCTTFYILDKLSKSLWAVVFSRS